MLYASILTIDFLTFISKHVKKVKLEGFELLQKVFELATT